jgi:hypothetical protein
MHLREAPDSCIVLHRAPLMAWSFYPLDLQDSSTSQRPVGTWVTVLYVIRQFGLGHAGIRRTQSARNTILDK